MAIFPPLHSSRQPSFFLCKMWVVVAAGLLLSMSTAAAVKEEMTLTAALSSHHDHRRCGHARVSKLPGYGRNAEIVSGRSAHEDAAFQPLQSTTTFESIRLMTEFDQGDCAASGANPAAPCGHCEAEGRNVTNFEGQFLSCLEADVLTPYKKAYLLDIVASAKVFMESALKVKRLTAPLVLGGSSRCGSQPGTPLPAGASTTGFNATDLLVLVTAAPAGAGSHTLAWATGCRALNTDGRVIVAQINWNPAMLPNNASQETVVQQHQDFQTAIHELLHPIGFTEPYFTHPSGYLNLDGTFNNAGNGFVSGSNNAALGKPISYVQTPRVVREARDYFGCPSLTYVEVEDGGGSGTAGSHWEKRTHEQETMNGVASTDQTFFSRMTLALLEDTGYYQVNYDKAELGMTYGKSKGCSFLQEKCNSVANSAAGGEFCFSNSTTDTFCAYDYLGGGLCQATMWETALPSQFRYFADSREGGISEPRDYCPTVQTSSSIRCVVAKTPTRAFETFGVSSRCYSSNLVTTSSTLVAMSTRKQTRCFLTVCNAENSTVSIAINGVNVNCPTAGGAVALPAELSATLQGEITCPAFSRVCTGAGNSLIIMPAYTKVSAGGGSAATTTPSSPTNATSGPTTSVDGATTVQGGGATTTTPPPPTTTATAPTPTNADGSPALSGGTTSPVNGSTTTTTTQASNSGGLSTGRLFSSSTCMESTILAALLLILSLF